MFWCSIYFISDIYYHNAEHCMELCICLVTSIASIFIPYLAKSYFGKKNEELLKNLRNEENIVENEEIIDETEENLNE